MKRVVEFNQNEITVEVDYSKHVDGLYKIESQELLGAFIGQEISSHDDKGNHMDTLVKRIDHQGVWLEPVLSTWNS